MPKSNDTLPLSQSDNHEFGNNTYLDNGNLGIDSEIAEKKEKSLMQPTSKTDIDALIHDHGEEIIQFLHEKQKEKDLSNADLMFITRIPQTSFYRIWNNESARPNSDHICRLCLALGVSIDEFKRDPTEDSTIKLPALKANSHEEIMTNMVEEYTHQKETIAALNNEIDEKNTKIAALESALAEKNDELLQFQRKSSDRINKLTDALLERHDQMHELNILNNRRVDELEKDLHARYDLLYKLFNKLTSQNTDTLMSLIDKNVTE